MVQRPEDVSSPRDAEASTQAVATVDRFDDHALVGVEVALDELPQRATVAVDLGRAADDLEQSADAGLRGARGAGVELQLPNRIALVDDLAEPFTLGDGGIGVVAFEAQIPQRRGASRSWSRTVGTPS